MIQGQTRSDLLDSLICALDPVAFARSLGIEPDPWQADALRSPHKRIQILAARQSGKSMTCALYALWFALSRPKETVLIISPSLRQSQLMFRSVLDFYKQLKHPIPSDIETALTLRLTNRSMIVALPGLERTIRGYRADCIIFDESALVDDATYRAVRPMAAVSDAKVFCIGTPHGQRGWFYQSWTQSDEYYKIKVTADDCPRISKEFLEQERRAMGSTFWYEQEYECIFHQADTSLFRLELIEQSILDYEELDLGLDDDDSYDSTAVPLQPRVLTPLHTQERSAVSDTETVDEPDSGGIDELGLDWFSTGQDLTQRRWMQRGVQH